MTDPLLQIRNLQTSFKTEGGLLHAVNGVSLDVHAGETLALVGESGCGKSATAFSVLGLIQNHSGSRVSGSIIYDGQDLVGLPTRALNAIRGRKIGMIFQDPMTSLNPVLTIGSQLEEAIRTHKPSGTAATRQHAAAMLERVQIPDPRRCLKLFPHELSGGMRQRVMIAIALSCEPGLLIADEPTTALDVTVQRQILDLIDNLKRESNMGVMLITHDMGVVAQYANRVAVMYAGRVVETGQAADLFRVARHPYTRGLLASMPIPRRAGEARGSRRLVELPGAVPDPLSWGKGCHFRPRCAEALEVCARQTPELRASNDTGTVACFAHTGQPSGSVAQ